MEIIRKIRVSFGYVFSILLIIMSKPVSVFYFWFGAAIAIFGELIRVWASSYIVKLDRLTTDGPYRATRNPLYLGSFIMGTGLLIISMNLTLAVVYYVLFLIVYPATMSAEKKELQKKFGDYYLEYQQGTPGFFPTFESFGEAFSNFRFFFSNFGSRIKSFLKNREYNGVLAVTVVLLILFFKLKRNLKK